MVDKDAAARSLADKHYQIESGMTEIFRISGRDDVESDPNEPIKLLEVNRNTISTGIMPIQFGPSPAAGVHFPSIILEITPAEYEQIERHELSLPHGWTIGERFPNPNADGA